MVPGESSVLQSPRGLDEEPAEIVFAPPQPVRRSPGGPKDGARIRRFTSTLSLVASVGLSRRSYRRQFCNMAGPHFDGGVYGPAP